MLLCGQCGKKYAKLVVAQAQSEKENFAQIAKELGNATIILHVLVVMEVDISTLIDVILVAIPPITLILQRLLNTFALFAEQAVWYLQAKKHVLYAPEKEKCIKAITSVKIVKEKVILAKHQLVRYAMAQKS